MTATMNNPVPIPRSTARVITAPGPDSTDLQPNDLAVANRLLVGGSVDPLLQVISDTLSDLENTRTANENRYRSMRDVHGLSEDLPEMKRLRAIVDGFVDVEHQAVLEIQRQIRKHRLYPWLASQRGVGEKQGARLIATLGDPAWHDAEQRPRKLRELWAYCGLHVIDSNPAQVSTDSHWSAGGVAPMRRKGQKANWSQEARKRAYLIAESCLKAGNPTFRSAYDEAKTKHADAVHSAPCARCTPAGKPAAPIGSPLTKAHIHARGMRAMMKEILRELWRESQRLHGWDN
jgi:hypothetical protein